MVLQLTRQYGDCVPFVRCDSMAEFADFVQLKRMRYRLGGLAKSRKTLMGRPDVALALAGFSWQRRCERVSTPFVLMKGSSYFSPPATTRVPERRARLHRRDLVVECAADLAAACPDRSAGQARMRVLRAVPQRPDPA